MFLLLGAICDVIRNRVLSFCQSLYSLIRPGGTYGDNGNLTPLTFHRYISPISIRDADYSHQIVLSLLDLKTFHRPVNYLVVIISYCSTYKYASQYLSVNAEAKFFAP